MGHVPDLLVELEDEILLGFAAVLQRSHVHVAACSGLCSQAHNFRLPLLHRILQRGPLQRSSTKDTNKFRQFLIRLQSWRLHSSCEQNAVVEGLQRGSQLQAYLIFSQKTGWCDK